LVFFFASTWVVLIQCGFLFKVFYFVGMCESFIWNSSIFLSICWHWKLIRILYLFMSEGWKGHSYTFFFLLVFFSFHWKMSKSVLKEKALTSILWEKLKKKTFIRIRNWIYHTKAITQQSPLYLSYFDSIYMKKDNNNNFFSVLIFSWAIYIIPHYIAEAYIIRIYCFFLLTNQYYIHYIIILNLHPPYICTERYLHIDSFWRGRKKTFW
jgi:hypothetical protein